MHADLRSAICAGRYRNDHCGDLSLLEGLIGRMLEVDPSRRVTPAHVTVPVACSSICLTRPAQAHNAGGGAGAPVPAPSRLRHRGWRGGDSGGGDSGGGDSGGGDSGGGDSGGGDSGGGDSGGGGVGPRSNYYTTRVHACPAAAAAGACSPGGLRGVLRRVPRTGGHCQCGACRRGTGATSGVHLRITRGGPRAAPRAS